MYIYELYCDRCQIQLAYCYEKSNHSAEYFFINKLSHLKVTDVPYEYDMDPIKFRW